MYHQFCSILIKKIFNCINLKFSSYPALEGHWTPLNSKSSQWIISLINMFSVYVVAIRVWDFSKPQEIYAIVCIFSLLKLVYAELGVQPIASEKETRPGIKIYIFLYPKLIELIISNLQALKRENLFQAECSSLPSVIFNKKNKIYLNVKRDISCRLTELYHTIWSN